MRLIRVTLDGTKSSYLLHTIKWMTTSPDYYPMVADVGTVSKLLHKNVFQEAWIPYCVRVSELASRCIFQEKILRFLHLDITKFETTSSPRRKSIIPLGHHKQPIVEMDLFKNVILANKMVPMEPVPFTFQILHRQLGEISWTVVINVRRIQRSKSNYFSSPRTPYRTIIRCQVVLVAANQAISENVRIFTRRLCFPPRPAGLCDQDRET